MATGILARARLAPGQAPRDLDPTPVRVQNQEPTGFFDALGAQFTTQGTSARLLQGIRSRAASERGVSSTVQPGESREEYVARVTEFDPERYFKEDPALKERVDNLSAAQLERIYQARNPEHLALLVEQSEKREEAADTIQRAGLAKGLSAAIAASIVDPVDLLIGIASGGVSRGSLLMRAGTGALAAGTATAGLETALSTDDPTRTTTDIVLSGIFGAALGGTFGVAFGRSDSAIEKTVRTAGERLARDVGYNIDDIPVGPAVSPSPATGSPTATVEPPTPDGYIRVYHSGSAASDINDGGRWVSTNKTYASDYRADLPLYYTDIPANDPRVNSPDYPDTQGVRQGFTFNFELRPEEAVNLKEISREAGGLPPDADTPAPQPQSVGAAAATREPPPEFFGESFTAPTSWTRLLQAKSVPNQIRGAATKIIAGLPFRDKSRTKAPPAEIVKATMTRQLMAQLHSPETWTQFRKWSDAQGYGKLRRELGNEPWQKFMESVGRAMRGGTNESPEAVAAAKQARKVLDDFYAKAKDAGFPGFVDELDGTSAIKPDPNYVPRKINGRKFVETMQRLGRAGTERLVRGAILAKTPDLDPGLAGRIAKAVVDRAIHKRQGSDVEFLNGISEDSVERLRYYLPDDDPKLVDDVIAYLKKFRQEGNRDAGRPGPTRFRIDLDENYEMTLPDGSAARFGDILEENADVLLSQYVNQMTGWLALKRTIGVNNDADIKVYMDRIREELAAEGKLGDDTAQSLDALQKAINLVLGRPLYEQSDAATTTSVVSKFNIARTLNQAWAAQTEMANGIALGGFRVLLAEVPALRALVRGKDKPLKEKALQDEIRYVMGIGNKLKAGVGKGGIDEFGDNLSASRMLGLFDRDAADRFTSTAARTTSMIGLLGPLQDAMATYTGRALAHRMGRFAMGREQMPEWMAARLRDAGVSDARQRDILEEFRKHASVDSEGFVYSHNFSKWNSDVRFDYEVAANAMIYRAIQENDIGSSAPWMNHWMGRILSQLKSFVINAWVKQTIYDAHFRDSQVFSKWVIGLTLGSIFYYTRTWINHGHNEEEFARRTSPEKVALSAVNYLGAASMIPSAVDMAWLAATTGLKNEPGTEDDVIRYGQAIFGFGRTSGLGTDLLSSNPTVDLVNNTIQAGVAPVRAAFSEDVSYSQADLDRLRKVLPFSNAVGVARLFDWLGEDVLDLPETPRE